MRRREQDRGNSMRILTVSDKVEPVLYGPYIRERVGKVDLVLACGDLPYYYLEYIVGLLDVPLCFVHGNHDQVVAARQGDEPATSWSGSGIGWAADLHMRSHSFHGVLLAGLEGCRRYRPGAPYQYSESDVRCQVMALGCRLLLNKARYGRYVDILITHAPPRGIHDGEDLPHRGFESYLKFMRVFRPILLIHGHQHVYDRNVATDTVYEGTRVLNTYGYRVIELAPRRDHAGWELVSSSR